MRSNRRYWFDTVGNSRFQGHFQSNQLFKKILIDIPRDYIINNSYNYTGVAVVNSEKYGKIYVQMFLGR